MLKNWQKQNKKKIKETVNRIKGDIRKLQEQIKTTKNPNHKKILQTQLKEMKKLKNKLRAKGKKAKFLAVTAELKRKALVLKAKKGGYNPKKTTSKKGKTAKKAKKAAKKAKKAKKSSKKAAKKAKKTANKAKKAHKKASTKPTAKNSKKTKESSEEIK